MGLLNWLKKTFATEEINLEDYSYDKLANEKWINHYFQIGFTFPIVPKKDMELLLENERAKIFDVVIEQLINADIVKKDDYLIYKGSLKKNVTILISEIKKVDVAGKKTNYCEFLIRFIDMILADKKAKNKSLLIGFREKKPNDKRSYLFSPLESITAIKIKVLSSIEFGLIAHFGIKPTKVMKSGGIIKNFYWVNEELYYKEYDGIQYFSYPLKKRIELHAKNPELEKLVFQARDNDFFFEDFIKEMMSKKNDNKHMKKYCQEAEEIIKELKIQIPK